MLISYASVSYDDQDLDLQRDALRKGTSGKVGRQLFLRLMESLRADDTLVVWRFDLVGARLKLL